MSRRSHFLEPLLESAPADQQLSNERTGIVVASEIELAADSRSRNRGLLGRSSLAPGTVMIIAPCNAIHTLFMRFSIDIVFVDKRGNVLKVCRKVRPWRIRVAISAFAALELAEGGVDQAAICVGDRLVLAPKGWILKAQT
jgi:uncharacterized protein